MSRFYRQNAETPKGDNYNTLKSKLEQETENLLKERNYITHKFTPADPFPSQNTIIEQSGLEDDDHYPGSYLHVSTPLQESEKKKVIKKKIEEIIKICNDKEKEGEVNEFGEIVEAEKQILDFLSKKTPEESGSKNRHQRSMQMGTDSNPHTFQAKSQKSSIREQINQRYNHVLGDDAMEMIEQIERKALIQIESLRTDKIQLLKKLNEEIKEHNEEKKRCAALEMEVKHLREELSRLGVQLEKRKGLRTPPQSQPFPRKQSENSIQMQKQPVQAPNDLESQILKLEEENAQIRQMLSSQQHTEPQFSRYNQEKQTKENNEKLRAELNALENKIRSYEAVLKAHDPQNNFEVDNLWNEGEEINQEGKRLLRISSKPEFQFHSEYAEDAEKNKYFHKITNLKEKIRQLEIENEGLQKKNPTKYDSPNHSYGFSSRQTRSPTYQSYGHKPTTSNYEKVIAEMKKASKS